MRNRTSTTKGESADCRKREEVSGSQGNDFLIGDSDIDSLNGNDHINGGDDDVLEGFGGSDNLNGGYEDDTIYARENSTRKGTATVMGGTGGDDMYAVDGAVDKIDCGACTDYVEYDIGIEVVAANCEQRFAT